MALAFGASAALAQTPEYGALPTLPAPASTGQTLPNGATSINETYGDWTVSCTIENSRKSCLVSQSQGNKQTGQRSFAVQLRRFKDGVAEGTILMPFGLKLEAGALLKLDERDVGHGLRFSTCIPEGCLIPLSLPDLVTDAMQTGKVLTVAALNMSSGQAVTFNVSLNGFAAAFKRIAELGS